MDIYLIGALILVTAWMLVCAAMWRHWHIIAKLNRTEATKAQLHLERHGKYSYNKGYARGLQDGIEHMYKAAHQARANTIVLAALNAKGHELVGTPEIHEFESA